MPSPVRSLVALAALFAASPAFADAVTYQGTLGKTQIVVELSAPLDAPSGKLVGRYFYAAKGIDIPLDAVGAKSGEADLAEEKPCTDDTCSSVSDDNPKPPPLGGKWHLEANADRSQLAGNWTDNGKSLPLALTRAGTRKLAADFDGTPAGLASIVDDITDGKLPLTEASSPYDYLRMQMPVTTGATTIWGDVAFAYDSNPRTKFPFPRIVKAGGTDVAAANTYLEQRHWQWNAAAFSCAAQAYQGLGWNDTSTDAIADLGGWQDETVEVTYLSPALMSWDEAGSLFCGGAHPDNHDDPNTLDIRTGKPLDLSLLFKGWVPTPIDDSSPKDLASARAKPDEYLWGPNPELADFIFKHLPADEVANSSDDDGCGSKDNIQQNLAISFVRGDKVRFSLTDMPSVAANCNGKLVDLPLSTVKPLLTPQAADYFPSLKP